MTATDLDFTVLESIELEIPCDYDDGEHPWATSHGAARWIGHGRCPACHKGAQRLLCTSCKDFVIATPDGCKCGDCDERIVPFRRAFKRFEPLGRY